MGSQQRFEPLRELLTQGRVLIPGDDGYDDSLKRWSSTCIKPAAAVVQPRTTEEAAAAVKFLTGQGVAFNVKGGGHSTAPVSCAPSSEGAVLDLSLLRDVTVDVAGQTVTFGGGCLWADLDDALWPHRLATVGGTVSHTGVGGLILHGGYGFLSGLHGLAIDCLVSVEVVLADGTVVTASESDNADLFWAVRGAGSSFGVVTRFTSRVFPQGEVWGGLILFTLDKLPALVDFLNFWAANNDGRQVANLILTHAPPPPPSSDGKDEEQPPQQPLPVVGMQIVYTGDDPSVEGPAFFAPLLEIVALVNMVGVQPYPQINKGGDVEVFPAGRRYLFGGANFTLPTTLPTIEAISKRFFDFSRLHPGAGTEGSTAIFEVVSNARYRRVPSDSTAFNSRGDYYNIGFCWTWSDAAFDTEMRSYNGALQKEVRALGYDDGELRDGVGMYLNYVSSSTLTAKDAFGANGKRLAELKSKFDPNNVFDKLWKLLPQKKEQQVV